MLLGHYFQEFALEPLSPCFSYVFQFFYSWRFHRNLLRILKSSARKMTTVTPLLVGGSGLDRDITFDLENLSGIVIPQFRPPNYCETKMKQSLGTLMTFLFLVVDDKFWWKGDKGNTVKLLAMSDNFQSSGYKRHVSLENHLDTYRGVAGQVELENLYYRALKVFARTIVKYVPSGGTLLVFLNVAEGHLDSLCDLELFSKEER